MDYVKLGKTGLKVSRLCLGCMSYGVPERGAHPWTLDEDESRPFLARALELGINFFDTSNSYSDGTSEEILGRAHPGPRPAGRGGDRDQGVLPDAEGPERPGPVAEGDPDGDRREPPAARHRLRRPVPDPPLGRRDADRGDARGAARRREGGQGPLPRRVVDVRLAVLQGALHWPTSTAGRGSSRCRTTTTCSTARRSGRCWASAPPRGSACSPGARSPAGGWPGRGTRRASTERAGLGRVRQDPLRRDRGGRPGGRRPRRRGGRRAGPAPGAGRAGLAAPASPPSRRRSSARRSRITWRTPWPRCRSKLSPEEMGRLEEPYVPHPVLGFS